MNAATHGQQSFMNLGHFNRLCITFFMILVLISTTYTSIYALFYIWSLKTEVISLKKQINDLKTLVSNNTTDWSGKFGKGVT